MRRYFYAMVLVVFLSLLLACGKSSQNAEQPSNPPATTTAGEQPAGTPALSKRPSQPGARGERPAAAANMVIPAGERIVVRLNQSVGSKISNSGDNFSATVTEPVTINNQVVIPSGASASGTVADAKALGRFKGGAVLRLVLDSVTVDGKTLKVQTQAASYAHKGKGKRSAVAIGGGAGLGALIGGLAGGGKGAAIGAAAGAGAGTAGAAFTGNKDIVLPAETAVSFKLTQPVEIR